MPDCIEMIKLKTFKAMKLNSIRDMTDQEIIDRYKVDSFFRKRL